MAHVTKLLKMEACLYFTHPFRIGSKFIFNYICMFSHFEYYSLRETSQSPVGKPLKMEVCILLFWVIAIENDHLDET